MVTGKNTQMEMAATSKTYTFGRAAGYSDRLLLVSGAGQISSAVRCTPEQVKASGLQIVRPGSPMRLVPPRAESRGKLRDLLTLRWFPF